ncbi:MAG TPA: TIGR04063 family PEP-CTERM/XrtA system glycosyltransferase [Burkholderiaceae bacterium]|nr:TIGR04063 family PEP-CTERM/XrtA system glycosyltransferase [Burkholderiaceae bacterium]
MRVLHVLDHSIPLQSGYTFRTRSILREQRRLGWQTFHLTSPKHIAAGPDEEEVDGLTFFRTRWQARGLIDKPVMRELALMRAVERRLEDIVARVKPQVLHAHSPVLNAIPALRVGRRHRIPVVYEVRAFWEDAAADHGTSREGGLRYRATRALETYALKRVDHVTTICEGLRADIVARGIAAERVTVIPNAVEPEAFQYGAPVDEELKTTLKLNGCTVVGFIGSFYAYEGLDLLIDAMPSILAARPDVRLLLVGGGPQEQALRAQVERLGLSHVVVFTGRVPHAQVARYYSVVDVFAYPRKSMRLTELVTPLKPLEAMAQGQLLIASDVGGHRELIRDGDTGMLFRADDAQALAHAALRMLGAGDRWQEIRAAGRRFIETERTWQRSVSRYAPIFHRLSGSAA